MLPASTILMLAGWGGLIYVIRDSLPTLGPRWLFFFLLVLALTGTSLPIVTFLNRRFPTSPPPKRGAVLREAIFVGLYFSLLAWLQLGRALTTAMAIFLATGFLLLELLIRLWTLSRWSP